MWWWWIKPEAKANMSIHSIIYSLTPVERCQRESSSVSLLFGAELVIQVKSSENDVVVFGKLLIL